MNESMLQMRELVNDSNALIELKTHRGYEVMTRKLLDLATAQVEKLIEQDDINARATIRAVQQIFDVNGRYD